MHKFILMTLLFLAGPLVHGQNSQLETSGSIVIGNSDSPNPNPGTMRWTGDDFEAYNGLKWVSMTGGRTAPAVDPDGNVYPTLKIGDQIWMLENLRTTKYADGTPIPLVTDNTQWANLTAGAYCWYQNNNIYDIPHGKLYNWEAVKDDRGLCPEGWNVPSKSDFEELVDFLGGADVAGGKLKQEGTSLWIDPNEGATNSSKFNAVPTVYRNHGGFFPLNFEGISTYLWSTTPGTTANTAYTLYMFTASAGAFYSMQNLGYGHPIRCVK